MTTKTGFIDQEAYRDPKQTLSRMQDKREQESRLTTLPELRMTTLELRNMKERAGSVRGGGLINSKIQFNALTSDSSIFFFSILIIHFREREYVRSGEEQRVREKESEANSTLTAEPDTGRTRSHDCEITT